jgi:large subunit ribosomal protein L30
MKQLKITLVKSTAGTTEKTRNNITGLGLRKTNSSKILTDSPCVRGMLNKVRHLVKIEELSTHESA